MCRYLNCTMQMRFMLTCMHDQERASPVLVWTHDCCHLETAHPRGCGKMQWAFSLLFVCSLFMLCFCKKRAEVGPFEGAALGDLLSLLRGEAERKNHGTQPAAPARRWRDCREQQGAANRATEPRKKLPRDQRRHHTVWCSLQRRTRHTTKRFLWQRRSTSCIYSLRVELSSSNSCFPLDLSSLYIC